MIVKVFQTNKSGKIEFTKKELETLLNEIYWQGYRNNSTWTYTTPWTYSTSTTPCTTNLKENNTATAITIGDKT